MSESVRGHRPDLVIFDEIQGVPDLPKVYIVPQAEFSSGDIAGALVSADKVWWNHMSSSRDWLIWDLTKGFTDRREELAAAFPNGYAVILLKFNEEPPEEIAHHFTKETYE